MSSPYSFISDPYPCSVLLSVPLPLVLVFPSFPSCHFSHFSLTCRKMQSSVFSIHRYTPYCLHLCVLLYLIPFIFPSLPLSSSLKTTTAWMQHLTAHTPTLLALSDSVCIVPAPIFTVLAIYTAHIPSLSPPCSCLSVLHSLKRWKTSSALFHLPLSLAVSLIASFHAAPAFPGFRNLVFRLL